MTLPERFRTQIRPYQRFTLPALTLLAAATAIFCALEWRAAAKERDDSRRIIERCLYNHPEDWHCVEHPDTPVRDLLKPAN